MNHDQVKKFMMECHDLLKKYDGHEHIEMVMGCYDKREDEQRPDEEMAIAVDLVNVDVRERFTAVIGSITEGMLRVAYDKGQLPMEVPCGGTSDCYALVAAAVRSAAHSLHHMAMETEMEEHEHGEEHDEIARATH